MTELLPEQRRRLILERLKAEGVVRVGALAVELAVTDETVRRDLKALDRQGIVVRSHGGATLIDRPEPTNGRANGRATHADDSFDERLRAMSAAKRAIAREAYQRVRAGQVIALDGSTTAWELACMLDLPRLTVVTNSLVVTNQLAARGDVQIICPGGTLDPRLQMFGGTIAEQALQRLQIDQAFISCAGIDADRGLSDPSDAAAQFKRKLLDIADRTTLLADSSKLNRKAVVFFAEARDVDELIIDETAGGAATVERLRGLGVACSLVRA